MIWYYIIQFFNNFFGTALSALGVPRIEKLPLGMDDALITGFGYFYSFMALYPPIQIIFTATMWYLGFKIILLILKNIPIVKINT